jgi:hypothetical protein
MLFSTRILRNKGEEENPPDKDEVRGQLSNWWWVGKQPSIIAYGFSTQLATRSLTWCVRWEEIGQILSVKSTASYYTTQHNKAHTLPLPPPSPTTTVSQCSATCNNLDQSYDMETCPWIHTMKKLWSTWVSFISSPTLKEYLQFWVDVCRSHGDKLAALSVALSVNINNVDMVSYLILWEKSSIHA